MVHWVLFLTCVNLLSSSKTLTAIKLGISVTELSEVVMLTKNSSLLDSKMLSLMSVKKKHACGIDVDRVSDICVTSKSLPAAKKPYYYIASSISISLPTAPLDM